MAKSTPGPMPQAFFWRCRYPAPLYRYLDKPVYVDDFFASGKLRLSSFDAFRKHPNEQRRDGQEGLTTLHGRGPTQDAFAVVRTGTSTYVLCTSTRLDPQLATTFKCSSHFTIQNPLLFAEAVARALPRFVDAFAGLCIYSSARIVARTLPFDPKDLPTLPQGGYSMDDARRYLGAIDEDTSYLLKRPDLWPECEFRFLWRVNGPAEDSVFIECPDARQYCTR